MTALEQFQNRYGRAWGELIGSPAFAAALALANAEKNQEITQLSDDGIVSKGAILLADLRGHLKYESALLGLHEKKEFVFQELGAPEYPSGIDEARDEALEEAQRESGIISEISLLTPNVTERLFPKPKGKPRGQPPKRKKKK